MTRCFILYAALGAVGLLPMQAQIKRTSVPLGSTLQKALTRCSLTGTEARPFHLRVMVSEPENPQSPYQGTIEEWWVSPSQWRRELTEKSGMRQTVVMVDGKKTEHDEGDYFPNWLQSFVTALFDPIPHVDAWTSSDLSIDQITMPNGAKSDACVRVQSKIGAGEQAVDAFSNLCFDDQGKLKFFGSPGYDMEFHDYKGFGKQQIARKLANNPEPGTALVGEVTVLDEMRGMPGEPSLFTPLASDDNRFKAVQVDSGTLLKLSAGNSPVTWPAVRSGKTSGKLAMYISADSSGQVREAWPLNSDNAGLDDPAREQVRHWKLKPAVDAAGRRVQVEGGLGFVFETKIDNPLPVLNDAETRLQAISMVEPKWPSGGGFSGQMVHVDIGVNEQGVVTGCSFNKTSIDLQVAVNDAVKLWRFRPLTLNGTPQYFHGRLEFTVK